MSSEDVDTVDEDVEEDINDINDVGVESVFSPSVSATCRAGVMTIKVETENKFLGAVHSRDYRRPECTNYGQGTTSTSLNINLLADRSSDQFCGVFVNKVTDANRNQLMIINVINA